MANFNMEYAQECLDQITSVFENMVSLYVRIGNQNKVSEKDMRALGNMYNGFSEAIGYYFEYLDKVNIPREKSCLRHWLDQWDEVIESISSFLEDEEIEVDDTEED